MVATAFATQRRTRSNVAGDELVLRVSGPTRDGRIVRLKSHKCTIGAGKYCSLRLRAPGVAPLHCLVVRGRAGAVVRRWAADTLLNHQAFDDAPLLPGDRLSVGPVELEVLGVGADPQQPPETSHSDDSARLDELETERQSLDGQRRQWQAEQEESRRKLDEQLSLLTTQAAELESQRNSLAEEHRQRETEREQHLAAEEYRSEESTPGNEPQAETSDAADGEDNSLLEKGATAGLSSSVGRNTRENTAGQASSGTREESIEEYMGRLMQRTQASSDTSVVPYRSPPAAASGAPATAPVAETMEPSSTAPVPAPQRREPAQVAPRAKAPEKHVNLSAMRELANLSAQNALSRYSRRILVKAMYSKLLVVAVALASAASLLWMWKTTTGWQTTLYLALVALIVAIYWGVQYALLSGRLMINKSGHIQWHSSAGYGNGASKAAESSDEKPSGETASDPRPPNPDPRPPL